MTLSDKDRLKDYLNINSNVNATNAKKIITDLLSEKSNWGLADDWQDFFLDSIYGTLGVAYSELHDWDKAISYFKLAVDAANKNWPEYGYGNKYRCKGDGDLSR